MATPRTRDGIGTWFEVRVARAGPNNSYEGRMRRL